MLTRRITDKHPTHDHNPKPTNRRSNQQNCTSKEDISKRRLKKMKRHKLDGLYDGIQQNSITSSRRLALKEGLRKTILRSGNLLADKSERIASSLDWVAGLRPSILISKTAYYLTIASYLALLAVRYLMPGSITFAMAVSVTAFSTQPLRWDHSVDLNEDFRIFWKIINQDIAFEIQARTLGYVGFGFTPDGSIAGSDMAIGWVDKGQTYFQDRHVPRNGGDLEPVVDPSQDYILMKGYENDTHTVLRYRRKLDTCDTLYDIAITNNTMRLLYMYNEADPPYGSVKSGHLPNPLSSYRPYRSMVLTQHAQTHFKHEEHLRILELRNEDVQLPNSNETLIWCKMFKIDDMHIKHHLIRYEPIYDSPYSINYMQHITLRECHGMHQELEGMVRELGRQCQMNRDIPTVCASVVASWSRGSHSFTYPEEVGYPLESRLARYFLMETHYSNLQADRSQTTNRQMADNSGLKIYFTHMLRRHDAGVLSIGMDPNWRHIIPPGQPEVISLGQCIEDCTAYAFPKEGIQIFAVMMRTHLIGREVKLRQIRQTEELPPIAEDSNIDVSYQDFRRLSSPVHVLPGDRLIAECVYDSSTRKAITLGGLTMKEECCIILALYYPRQNKLTTCHSLPSLPTVLHSLGIEQLVTDSNPVLIAAPAELAGMTLEIRLLSYDWKNQFNEFQDATKKGSFKPVCWGVKHHIVPSTEYLEGHSINVTKVYRKQRHCKPKRLLVTEKPMSDISFPILHEIGNNNVIEGAAQSSSQSSANSHHLLSMFTILTQASEDDGQGLSIIGYQQPLILFIMAIINGFIIQQQQWHRLC